MSVFRPGTASKTMSPPLPPSPPSGPPNSTNFSRRKLTAPGPPAPERTKILAWSRKCIAKRRLGDAGGEGNLEAGEEAVDGVFGRPLLLLRSELLRLALERSAQQLE